MPKKVNKEEQVEDVEDVESEGQESQESEKEIEIQPKRIIRKTNRNLKLAVEAENGSDNIEKIVAYKKKTSEKQLEHMKKARLANKKKIENTKLKMSEIELLKKENELLKRELEFGTQKRSFKKPVEKKEAPLKKVQIQEPPKPNFYGIM